MDYAEEFILNELHLPFAILFCLPELESFYVKREWKSLDIPVTLQQSNGSATWPESVMVWPAKNEKQLLSLHVLEQEEREEG